MVQEIPTYVATLLQLANIFISIFIIIIAYLFFEKTKPHKERTPWILLFVAVIIFFFFELSGLIFRFVNPIPEVRDFFKTLFIAFVLYVFVYQNYLLKTSSSIIIDKKETTKKDEKEKNINKQKKLQNKINKKI